MDQKQNKADDQQIGAIWKRIAKDGKSEYFSGKINVKALKGEDVVNIVVFSNRNKVPGDKTPDYHILKSLNTNTAATPSAVNPPKKTLPPARPIATKQVAEEDEILD